MIEHFKARVANEKAVIIGLIVTVLWYLNDGIVDGDWSDWRTLIPLITAAVIRVFVTSVPIEEIGFGFRTPPEE